MYRRTIGNMDIDCSGKRIYLMGESDDMTSLSADEAMELAEALVLCSMRARRFERECEPDPGPSVGMERWKEEGK